jgi:hypothetical protein
MLEVDTSFQEWHHTQATGRLSDWPAKPVSSHTGLLFARSEILTVVTMKITILWDVTSCSLIDFYYPCSEKLATIYQTKLHTPEGN